MSLPPQSLADVLEADRVKSSGAAIKTPPQRTFYAAALGAVALVLVAYSNSFHNGFHFDDSHIIVDNLFIRDLANIPRFFIDAQTYSANPANAAYRPLVTLTFAIDYWLAGGLNPVWFHVTQLTLLIVTGLLLYMFYVNLYSSRGAGRSSYWAALFAATFFCVHTGNTQTGNFMNARSELLSGLGVLVAFLIYIKRPRLRRYLFYLVPVVVGTLAKMPAVMFAPLLLCYSLLIEEQLSVSDVFSRKAWPQVKRSLLTATPAFVLAIGLYVFVDRMNSSTLVWGGVGREQYLLTQTWMWLRYVRLFFVPTGLSADTDIAPFTSWVDWKVAAGIVLLLLSLVAIWRASRSRELRPVAFGIAWFWIALVPTSTIFPLGEVTNDHRVFFPFMGLAAAVVWLVTVGIAGLKMVDSSRHRLPQIVVTGAAIVLLAHVIGTHQRNRVWLNAETLWHDVVEKSPRNGRGLMNYGLTQMEQGRYTLAKDYFTRAYAINPNYVYLQINLAIVSDAMGDTTTAEAWFQRALATDANHPGSHQFFASWLARHGRAPEAIPHLQKAIALSSGTLDSRDALLDLYAARGDSTDLKVLAQQTLQHAGGDPVARAYSTVNIVAPSGTSADWYRRGLAETGSGRHARAAWAYRTATSIDPKNADAWNNLGWSLNVLGFFAEAIPALETAVGLRPDYTLARNNLAYAKTHIPINSAGKY